MSNWWETSDSAGGQGGWDTSAGNTEATWDTSAAQEPAAAYDPWAAAATPAGDADDTATKIKQLREGRWTDEWKEFEYYDEATAQWIKDPLDQSLGQKGWWKFLYHEGKEWQPEDLANHLEQQAGGAGAQTDAQTGDAAQTNASWGNWDGAAAAAPAQDAWPVPNAKAFWEMQQWNISQNVLSQKTEDELTQDDHILFEGHGTAAGIDFSCYNNVPVDVSGSKSQNIPVLNTFDEIYSTFAEIIPEACVENVRKCQYTVPTPVQKYAVPVALAGRDVMCCAQTGSGKTAAFLIPAIGLMMKNHNDPIGHRQVPFDGPCKPDTLIMTPTRELCIQIHDEAIKFCHRTGYRCCKVYGGAPTKGQLEDISKGADLLTTTPGRLQDFINRGVIDVSNTYVLVLDEADRMLDMGFESQVREIVENHNMPKNDERQTMMFSATFPDECQKMAQDFLWDYIWIGVGIVGGAVTTVTQSLIKVDPKEKYQQLIQLLDEFYRTRSSDQRCLVFVNAKDTAKWLDEQLYQQHYDTGALHGNLTQDERETNLSKFRKGDIDVMVATDVAARGLDIEKVDLVVNFDMPNEIDTYVHRIGRSGRIGNRGAATTFISTDENGKAYENLDTLAQLAEKMRGAGSEIPSWLEEQLAGKNDSWGASASDKNDSWGNWGGKDARAGW